MTLQDAIKRMADFYRAFETLYTDPPKETEVVNKVKERIDACLDEASDAMDELEKMQTVGIDCGHCKYSGSDCNACKECMFFWLALIDQKRPLNYEPI